MELWTKILLKKNSLEKGLQKPLYSHTLVEYLDIYVFLSSSISIFSGAIQFLYNFVLS